MTSDLTDKTPDGLTVLVVDDSRTIRRVMVILLGTVLSHANFIQAENGQDALNIVKESQVDLVFLDLNMPELDGFWFLEQLKELGLNRRVIVVSANFQPKAIERCLALGALAFLRKPATPDELRKTLHEVGVL